MTTISVSDDTGQLTMTVDGGEPQQIQTADDACQVIEQTFGQPDGEMAPEEMTTDGMESDMQAGFQAVRGGGLNG